MKKTLLLISAILIVGYAIYWFSYPEVCGDCDPPHSPVEEMDIVRPGFPNANSIPITHTIEENRHTMKGVLTLPDPCYSIEHTVDVKLPIPEFVSITLTTPRSEELCATVVTDKEFEISFDASEDAIIQAFLNGKEVVLFEGEK